MRTQKSRHDEDTNPMDPTGMSFSIHLDKLVIALGAYVILFFCSSFLDG